MSEYCVDQRVNRALVIWIWSNAIILLHWPSLGQQGPNLVCTADWRVISRVTTPMPMIPGVQCVTCRSIEIEQFVGALCSFNPVRNLNIFCWLVEVFRFVLNNSVEPFCPWNRGRHQSFFVNFIEKPSYLGNQVLPVSESIRKEEARICEAGQLFARRKPAATFSPRQSSTSLSPVIQSTSWQLALRRQECILMKRMWWNECQTPHCRNLSPEWRR
jgi:hypothetical protein